MNKTIFITTSIPYVNSRPHIGHAQEFIIADCIARIYRSQDYNVTLQTGTDENAFKNVLAAHNSNISPQEFVDKNAEIFRSLAKQLNISFDTFIRTTEPRHYHGVHEFWSRLNTDDLYTRSYEGLYCVGCEDFFLEKDLENGVCPDHKTIPDKISEQNVFFRLSRYQKTLENFITSGKIKIYPEIRKNEALSFIRQGLHDISLTRAKHRSGGWGIPVPGHPDQVVYVWIDALINYLTGQGFGENLEWKKIWNEDSKKVHVIGKNVWKFHAVYWPALLLSAGLPVPDEIIVHGFLTNNGVKISKSLGNSIDPSDVIKDFGADPIRHLLLNSTPIYSDSDFSIERLCKVYETDLANRLGNLYSRLRSLCEKAQFKYQLSSNNLLREKWDNLLSHYSLQEISKIAWDEIDLLNGEIHHKEPWKLLKSQDLTKLYGHLERWCHRLYLVTEGLEPFIPETSQKIQNYLKGDDAIDKILFPRKL